MSPKRPAPSIREQNEAIDDLRERYAQTLDLLVGPTSPLWERTQQALGCYAGVRLELDDPGQRYVTPLVLRDRLIVSLCDSAATADGRMQAIDLSVP